MSDILNQLKQIREFKNVPETQLQWIIDNGKFADYEEGEKFFKPGDDVNEMHIVIKGDINLYREQAGNLQYLETLEKNEITGTLPYSRLKTAIALGVVENRATVLSLSKEHFPEMIHNHYELTQSLVHAMTDRVRDFTKQQQQNDKMMALGKLSAGLAHELNNPSAAVVRSANELKKHLGSLPHKFKSVIKIKTTDDVVDQVNNLVFAKIKESTQSLTLMQKTEREDEIIQWLEENAIDDAYSFGETFADFNFTVEDFEKLKAILRPEDKAAVINWLHQVLTTESLVTEIEEASRRINTLVTSIKRYTHMDQAPEKEKANIHDGIKTTLTMLNHKIKRGNIKLIENYQPDLPQASIYISSMNQVWTNLIDNAIDALEGNENGIIEIETKRDKEFIAVTISDNGPGIPEDIQSKIFDPFFTTKPIGKGTGLGLEVVHQIINQHHGNIEVKSIPGKTEFIICFPING